MNRANLYHLANGDSVKYLSCVLVKPSGNLCNLKCSYCFYIEKKNYMEPNERIMNYAVLKKMTKQCLGNARKNISFIWQGGEPTTTGIDFYKRALKFQQKYKKGKTIITNSIQTNGLLIDRGWCDFFKENNFLIGISLDGPQHVHDRYRLNLLGNGSWHVVHESARMLIESGTMINAVSCVTDYSSLWIDEIYAYLKKLGFAYLQFIPVIELNRYRCAAHFSVSPLGYGKFLRRLFDLWLADFSNNMPTISIRFFDTICTVLLGLPSPECCYRNTCGDYLVIEKTGDVYPCDFFVSPCHLLGNLKNIDLHTLFNSKRQYLFGYSKARLTTHCMNCNWLKFCGGGCLKDRRNNPAGFHLNYFCESFKYFFSYAIPILQKKLLGTSQKASR